MQIRIECKLILSLSLSFDCSLCCDCSKGKLADCFNEGCITSGGTERTLMTIDKRIPGPAINVCHGDRIVVDVANHMLGQGLTIHWHGIHQQKSPWMDGIAMITQCPIEGGNTFRYDYEATNIGTQMWHAHSGFHRSNGIVGSLVVREKKDPHCKLFDFDLSEHTLVLMDMDLQLAEDKMPGMISEITLPNYLLINGFGSFRSERRKINKFAPIAAFYVERGKRHRFRIINAGSQVCPFEVTVRICFLGDASMPFHHHRFRFMSFHHFFFIGS